MEQRIYGVGTGFSPNLLSLTRKWHTGEVHTTGGPRVGFLPTVTELRMDEKTRAVRLGQSSAHLAVYVDDCRQFRLRKQVMGWQTRLSLSVRRAALTFVTSEWIAATTEPVLPIGKNVDLTRGPARPRKQS